MNMSLNQNYENYKIAYISNNIWVKFGWLFLTKSNKDKSTFFVLILFSNSMSDPVLYFYIVILYFYYYHI